MSRFSANELTDLIAVVSIAIALFACIALDYKDLAFATAGTLGGVIGVTMKNKSVEKVDKSGDKQVERTVDIEKKEGN